MRPISEPDIQAAVTDLLNSYPELSLSILQATHLVTNNSPMPACLATQSVRTPSGETDIVLDIQCGDIKHVLLIELKLKAHFQPTQGARYKERVKARADHAIVHTILMAPEQYFVGANPEARHFDYALHLEQFQGWATEIAKDSASLELISECVERLSEGTPLGGKGLFEKLYVDVAEECERRGNSLRILNRATEWMSLKHPHLPNSVNLNYRIKSGVAEIRILSSYPGDRTPVESPLQPLVPVRSGGELFLKLAPLQLSGTGRRGNMSSHEIAVLVDSLEHLVVLWDRMTG